MDVRARCLLVRRGRRLSSYSSRVLEGKDVYPQSSCVGGPLVQAGLSPRIRLYFLISMVENFTLLAVLRLSVCDLVINCCDWFIVCLHMIDCGS